MRFLANENFPAPSVQLLRSAGFEVYSIQEEHGGWPDKDVLALAVRESLIILTFDRDYGELLFRYHLEPPPAVIYFRSKGVTPTDAGTTLLRLVRENFTFTDAFTVIDENALRQRMLR